MHLSNHCTNSSKHAESRKDLQIWSPYQVAHWLLAGLLLRTFECPVCS